MKPTLPLCLTRHIWTRLAVFSLLMLGIGQVSMRAQVLYEFTNDSTGAYQSIASNMMATGIQLGSAITHDNYPPCGPTEGLGTDGWPTTNVFNVNTFNSDGTYLTFTLSPNMGFGLNVTGFSARSRRENLSGTANDGPISMRYGYSTDGGATWTTVNPGNPQSSNLCVSGGVNRVWPLWQDTLTSNPIIFRIYALSSGSSLKGDLFIRDLTVEGIVCASNPSISPSPVDFLVCAGETQFATDYTVKDADRYSVNFDLVAETQGFVDVPVTALPAAPGSIQWVIPATADAGLYNATLSVWNDCGFKTDYPIVLTVSALPDVSASLSFSTICAGGSTTLTFEDNAMTGHLFRITGNLEDDNGTTPIDIPGVFDGASLVLTEGIHFNGNIEGSVTLTDIEIEDQTTGCTITAADVTIIIVPLPRVSVTLDDMAICDDGEVMLTVTDLDASGHLFTITADLMDDNGIAVGAINYTNLPSGASDTYTEGVDFEGSMSGMVTLTNIVILDQSTGCDTTLANLSITVNPLPVASFSVVPSTPICPGSPVEIYFNESAYSAGTEFGVTANASTLVLGQSMLTFTAVIDGDHVDLTEGTDFEGDVTFSTIVVTEPISGCSAFATDLFVDVLPAPEFAFSASSESDGPYAGNNSTGPNTLDVNFCAGNHLTLSAYSDNGAVGYMSAFTTTGNVRANGSLLPLASGPNNIAPASAAAFFDNVYGGAMGYDLVSGTSGTINQWFVPYLDNDLNGTFTVGDCLGDTMFLNYHVYEIPTVDAVANDSVCNGGVVSASFTGNYASGVTYSWTNDNPSIGLDASGTGDISFAGVNLGTTNAVANITVTPATDQCTGTPIMFTITVHPDALVSNLTAQTDSGDPISTNNLSGPASLVLNFCAGESFSFSGLTGTANMGFLEEIVAGTMNVTSGGPVPVPRAQSDISPLAALGFFNNTYGPYALSSGTYGWFEQVFTPYFDANNNGIYDPSTDCLGDPITIQYRIYAPIDLTITRNTPQDICSGETVEYVFSTTATEDVTFELVFEENPNANNPADLSDDNMFPATNSYTINNTTPYTFTTTVNNAMGSFDRGRVWVRAMNIVYNDADVCTTADVDGPNTRVYPKPVLAPVADFMSCDGNMADMNINLLNPSLQPSTAGFPMQVNWMVSGLGVVENGISGSATFLGANLVGGLDIQQLLTLVDPLMGPQTVTLTITPRASGPTNGFNADDCDGDAIEVEITVVPAPRPAIVGPTCLHDGGEVYLSGYDSIMPPATFVSGVWTDDMSGHATVDAFGVVTGVSLGTSVIYYTVTDDAGCVVTASHTITVLEELLLDHTYTGGSVSCGEDFTISVTVDGFCDVGVLDHVFSWDPAQFQLVTATATPIMGGDANVSALNAGMGQLIYSFFANVPPFGVELPSGTVILTYTLRALSNSGTYNIPLTIEVEEAVNSSFSAIPVSTDGVSIAVTPPSLDLGTNPVVCPSDDFVDITFTNVTGNPNYYVIDFDAAAEAAGFPDVQEGDLDFNDGYIRIPLPSGLLSGSYQATLVISNDDNGCESDVYLFSIIVDQTPPTASDPAPTFLDCVADIPAVNVLVVIDEDDDCTMPPVVAYEGNLSSSTGTGCANDPMIITRVYSVTDEAGNSITVSHVITVEDDIPPTVSTTGLASWYNSGQEAIDAVLARANATKMDNCSSLSGINVSVGAVDTMNCIAMIELVVTDACGNLADTDSTTYTVTIDRFKPVVTAGIIDDCYDEDDTPTAPYFEYGFAVQAAIAATTATDDCDMSLDITAVVTGTDCGTIITVTATDDCGKSSSVVYNTRVENDPPSISSDSLALDGMCFDNEQDALDAAVAATVAGDDCTEPGDLQMDPVSNGGCPAEITVFVTDFCGNFSTIVYTGVFIDVVDPMVNPAPLYETCFKTLAEAYDSLARAANPSDNCTDTLTLLATAQYSETEVGVLEDDCKEYDIHITFTDNCGNEVMHTFPTILIDNEAPVAMPLSTLMYACVDDVDVPNTGDVVAFVEDNCAIQDIIHVSTVLPTACPGTGVRTYRAFDCAGNSVDITQSIVINDGVEPTWITTPANSLDRTIDCADTSSITNALGLVPEAEDNCGNPSVVLESSIPLNSCAGGYIRTWRAYDDCGNSSTAVFTQIITIVDNTAPTWVTLVGTLDESVECYDADGLADAQSLQPTAMDNCTGYTLVKTAGVFVPGMTCPQEGTYTNTWLATDGCGNTSIAFTQVITITDNNGPTWVTPSGQNYPIGLNISVSCSDAAGLAFANTLAPVAVDTCGSMPVLTKTTGSFVAGGACVGEGTYTNTWVAHDACGNTSTVFTQVITVVDNTPPSFNPGCQFMPLTLTTSFGYDCPATATVTGLVVGQEIDKGYQWNVAGLTIDSLGSCIFDNCGPNGSIIVTVMSIENVYDTLNCSRTITISFQLRDACGNVQPTLFVCIYNILDDMAPTAVASTISTCFQTEQAALDAAIAATTFTDDCTALMDLEISAVRSGTLCNATITVTATDCAGNTSTPVMYNTRIDGAGPVMTVSNIATCYANVANAQAAAIAGTTIIDNCSSYGALIISATTVGTCPATVTVTATDQCGNSSSVAYPGLCIGASSLVDITDDADDLTVDCMEWMGDLEDWLDDNGGAEATGSGIVWSYMPLDPATMLQNSMANCTTHTKSVTVTFRATNGCGNFEETTATFSVQDFTPPTANLIANSNLACSTAIPAQNPEIVTGEADNCGGTPSVAWFASSDNGATGCALTPRIVVHQYVVTDEYCNTALVNQMITVVDNVNPTFTGPANTTVEVNAACVYNASPVVTGDVTDESDNCTPSGPGLQAFYTDVVNPGVNLQEKFVITRTWELFDACGNAAIPRVQTITVLDLTPPTIVGCPSNLVLPGEQIEMACGAYYGNQTQPAFSDNCSGAIISYELSGATNATGNGYLGQFDVINEGETTLTYTVTDEVGNTATCSFTISVNCLSISGSIIWEHDGVSGVNNATVNVTSAAPVFMGSDLSDLNGDYNISVPAAGTYRIRPVKNINRLNGVTAADATRITNHVNFSNPITNPYKKVCADVNRSGIINTQDATLITQSLLGNPTALAVFNVFWRFVPQDFVMPGTAHQNVPVFPEFEDVVMTGMDAVDVDFFGMKIGDVDAVWANPANLQTPAPLVWALQDQTLVAGTTLDLAFEAVNFNDLAAYQFALDFDPMVLEFIGFEALDALSLNLNDHFGAYQANLGELRHVWSNGEGVTLADGTPVFRAQFKVLQSGQKLSQVLRLDDSQIPCKAFNPALVPSDVRLTFGASVAVQNPLVTNALQLQLMQNRPNPFADATTIGFILPEACEAHIRILDISGRELTSYDRKYTAGYHELEFRMENAAAYGVLFCELVTPQGKRTIKMITAK